MQPNNLNQSQPHAAGATEVMTEQAANLAAEAQVALEWKPGDVILDTYEIKDIFESGGMGRVYRAHHRSWNIDLAIKCPRPDFFKTETQRENFIRECETWINLGLHPHIVSCFYVRNLGGVPRVFAEFVEGGSLEDWIETRKLYEGGKEKALERILDIAIQMAWGLQYAHEQGLVHQDVKPANVLMTLDGTAKVTDFGLAKARAMAKGTVQSDNGRSILVSWGGMMTPAYCSPEQGAGKPLSHKTDIWSWAVSILEMFTGEVTWMGGQIAGEALKSYIETGIGEDEIPAMPKAVEDLLYHCFEIDSASRPESLNAMGEQLQEIFKAEAGLTNHRQQMPAADLMADDLNNRAISLLDLGKEMEARQKWEQALEDDPKHLETVYNQGLLDWRQGKITDTDLLLRLKDTGVSGEKEWLLAYLLAQIHLERDDCESAISGLESLPETERSRIEIAHAVEEGYTFYPTSHRCLHIFEGHTNFVNSVCLSNDNRLALSGSWDNTLRLWDIASGECLRTFEGHTGCLSTDSRYVLSGSKDNTMRLWDVATGNCLRIFKAHTEMVNSVYLSTNGRFAISGSGEEWGDNDNNLRLWDIDTGECLRIFEGHTDKVCSVCLNSDNSFAISSSASKFDQDSTIRLWDVATGKCLRTFVGHTGGVNSVCLSTDDRFVLSGGKDYNMRLWDVATSKCLRIFKGHTWPVTSVCLSANSHIAISSGMDNTLRLWDVTTGRCLRTFDDHTNCVTSVSLSADGRFALTGSWDKTIRHWELTTQHIQNSAIWAFCRVISFHEIHENQETFRGEIEKVEAALSSGDYPRAIAYLGYARSKKDFERSPEALRLGHALSMRQPRHSLAGNWYLRSFEGHSDCVNSVCMSADNRYVLSGNGDPVQERDYTLRLWESTTGRHLRTFEGHTNIVNTVCLSADSRFALSGSFDYTLRLWELATGVCLRIFEGHTQTVTSVNLSADGSFALSGSEDNTIRLWDIATGKCLRTFEGHTKYVKSVCLSLNGRLALSGGCDNTLRLWDVMTGKCLHTFEGHADMVNSVCLSTDNRFALSGSGANLRSHNKDNSINTMRLWDVATGRCLRIFEGHNGIVNSVNLSTDGCFALSGSSDNTIHLWKLDWELEEKEAADWDEDARSYLQNFLTLHTPYAGFLPQNKEPTDGEITLALTRNGKPIWNEKDFKQLLYTLGCAGYGWLRPEGVRRELENMNSEWQDSQQNKISLWLSSIFRKK